MNQEYKVKCTFQSAISQQIGVCLLVCFVPLREGNFRVHCDFTFAPLNGHHTSAEVSRLAIHLDALLQELLL